MPALFTILDQVTTVTLDLPSAFLHFIHVQPTKQVVVVVRTVRAGILWQNRSLHILVANPSTSFLLATGWLVIEEVNWVRYVPLNFSRDRFKVPIESLIMSAILVLI